MQGREGSVTKPQQCRQFTSLPVPLSHAYQQLLTDGNIGPEVPHPNFDLSSWDQNNHCEYHCGPPGHSTDDFHKLRNKVQGMIDAQEFSLNKLILLNNQANPLQDRDQL
ncbi:hypothetical protein CDL15_Pgr000875 [Punica granatum]|nr:hypothetical protein CDL15_Pgr000875 [Punica granatum]